jgi:hypothetical protein
MLRIGVTGHRILIKKNKIEAGIGLVLSRIKSTYPDQAYTLISPLAEGADCLFAEKGLQFLSARLVVPLPLLVKEYLQDFTTERAKRDFQRLLDQADEVIQMPAQATREQAYQLVGEYVVSHSDILVAIWDGRSAQGPGGAGEVVQMARQRGLPLIWIMAGNRLPGTNTPTALGQFQGQVIYERFPGDQNR